MVKTITFNKFQHTYVIKEEFNSLRVFVVLLKEAVTFNKFQHTCYKRIFNGGRVFFVLLKQAYRIRQILRQTPHGRSSPPGYNTQKHLGQLLFERFECGEK